MKAKTKLTSMKTKILQNILLTLTIILLLGAAPVVAQSTVTEVVGGLHSPRGLAIGPGGQLFVSQTGDDTVAGSIIEVLNPTDSRSVVRTLVSGLPNVGEEGEFVGVDGISIFGNGANFGL
jgi:hypothetical protein